MSEHDELAITLLDEEGRETVFYVEDETRVNGVNYLLVVDRPEGDAECLILKDISDETSEEAQYVPVEDEGELEAVMKIFSEMLEDTELEM